MKCSNCGSEIKEGAKFCRECGSPVVEKTEALEENTCPECGNLLEENALFCNNCGQRIPNETDETEIEISNRCPKCNSHLKDGTLFCGECGTSLNGQPVKKTKSSESPKKKKDRGLVFLIALLIVVLIGSIGVIGYVYYQNNSADIETPVINVETKINEEDDEDEIETKSETLAEENEESDKKHSKDYVCIFVKSTDNTLNLRSLSKHESELVGKVESENMLMYYYGESGEGYGSDGIMHDWYKVYLDNDLQGWVRSDLVKVKE